MRKILVIMAAAFVLAACSTPADLRRNHPPITFTVKANYQLVLKRLVDRNQECTSGPLLPIGQVINDVQHYPDLRAATIVRGASGFGSQTHQVFDIKETAPGETEVSFTQRFRIEAWAAYYERVANGGGGCEP